MAKRKYQKRSTLSMVVMAIVAILVCAAMLFGNSFKAKAQDRPTPEQATIVKVGQMAPEFTVQMFEGPTINLADLKGKVVLLNFWATWCPPCRAELASVEKNLIERFKGQEFVFLPVSRGEKPATIAAFREKMGYTFPMCLDINGRVYGKYATSYIPRNFLIDKEGKIVKISIGYTEEEFAEMIEEIEKQLKK